MKKRPNKWLVLILGFILYVGSYLVLSSHGQYSSARSTVTFAMIRVDWAPVGFVIDGRWNDLLHAFYFPLYSLDQACWHQDTLHPVIQGPLQPAASP